MNYMQNLRKIIQWFKDGTVVDTGTPENLETLLENFVDVLGNTSQITTLADNAVVAAKIATNAVTTSKINALAVDGTKIPASAFRMLEFVGSNGAGDCTATGVKIGDAIVGILPLTTPAAGNASALFETVATKNDKIVQNSTTNLSSKTYMAFIIARS